MSPIPFKFCYYQYTSVHSVLKLIIWLGFDSLELCRRWTENHIKCPKHKALYELATWQLHRPLEEKCPINTWCCFLYLLVPLPLPLLSTAMLQVPAHSDLQLSTSILDLMILGPGRNLMIVPEVSTQNQGLRVIFYFPLSSLPPPTPEKYQCSVQYLLGGNRVIRGHSFHRGREKELIHDYITQDS